MHSKSNEKNKFLAISIAGHLGFLLAFFLVSNLSVSSKKSLRDAVEFEVADKLETLKPARLATPQEIAEIAKPANSPPPPNSRRVFGVNRNALTVDQANPSATEVKLGNTLAKENDSETLNPDDPDSVGVNPVEEFLVTELPKIEKDFRVPYPPEAKAQGLEGAVTFDLLIDASGKVRGAQLISGPGSPLNEAALEGVKQILFKPARIGNQTVAVRIRYVYRFILEN